MTGRCLQHLQGINSCLQEIGTFWGKNLPIVVNDCIQAQK